MKFQKLKFFFGVLMKETIINRYLERVGLEERNQHQTKVLKGVVEDE